MPRKSQKKQTRLAFAAPAPAGDTDADGDGGAENSDRFARLSYGHPSMATVVPKKSRKDKASKKSSSKTGRTKSPEPAELPVEEEPGKLQVFSHERAFADTT